MGRGCPHAITLYEATLAAREQVLGPDHPDTLTSRHNLATTRRRDEQRRTSSRGVGRDTEGGAVGRPAAPGQLSALLALDDRFQGLLCAAWRDLCMEKGVQDRRC